MHSGKTIMQKFLPVVVSDGDKSLVAVLKNYVNRPKSGKSLDELKKK